MRRVGGWNVLTDKHWLGEGILAYASAGDAVDKDAQVFIPIETAIRLEQTIRNARKEFWNHKIDLRKKPYRLVKQKAK